MTFSFAKTFELERRRSTVGQQMQGRSNREQNDKNNEQNARDFDRQRRKAAKTKKGGEQSEHQKSEYPLKHDCLTFMTSKSDADYPTTITSLGSLAVVQGLDQMAKVNAGWDLELQFNYRRYVYMEKDLGEIIVRETVSLIGLQGVDHTKRHHYWRCTDCGNVTMSEKAILAPSPCRCGSIEFETVWNSTLLR